MDLDEIKSEIQRLFEQLLKGQKEKAAAIARKHNPQLTTEDLLNPDNFQAVVEDPKFMYEDGIAAGILSAQIAVRAYLNSLSAGSVK